MIALKYCIGIDGGGTKTLAYLGDMEKRLIDNKIFGPSNYYSSSLESTENTFLEIVNYFMNKYNFSFDELEFISLGLAGVDREIDKKVIEDIFIKNGFSCHLIVNNDSRAALAGAFGKEEGVILISGTGSIAFGIRNNKEFRAGGWGHILADQGSGFDIGMQALRMVMKSYDGRVGSTKLTREVVKYLKIDHVEDIIGFVHNPETDKKLISKIAIIVAECGEKGDFIAIEILNNAAKDLAETVGAVIKKLYNKEETIEVAYVGGVITNIKYLRNMVLQILGETFPNIRLKTPENDAAIGALMIGWNKYGGKKHGW